MSAAAVLLRAINVGAHNRVSMSDLKALCEAIGYPEVDTYLQSGNLRISSPHSPKHIADTVEAALVGHGLRGASAIGLSWSRLEEIAAWSQWEDYLHEDTRGLAVFIQRPSLRSKELLGEHGGLNIVHSDSDVLLAVLKKGETHKVDFKRIVERPLGTRVTVRFWNVVQDWVAKYHSESQSCNG